MQVLVATVTFTFLKILVKFNLLITFTGCKISPDQMLKFSSNVKIALIFFQTSCKKSLIL